MAFIDALAAVDGLTARRLLVESAWHYGGRQAGPGPTANS